mmetsp:Transcript_8851/g.14792  ORF Transcript_8851/g.14792 Transcript_8851/m.14792 type:complete len:269 (+) Transcript_8851:52-858(+)
MIKGLGCNCMYNIFSLYDMSNYGINAGSILATSRPSAKVRLTDFFIPIRITTWSRTWPWSWSWCVSIPTFCRKFINACTPCITIATVFNYIPTSRRGTIQITSNILISSKIRTRMHIIARISYKRNTIGIVHCHPLTCIVGIASIGNHADISSIGSIITCIVSNARSFNSINRTIRGSGIQTRVRATTGIPNQTNARTTAGILANARLAVTTNRSAKTIARVLSDAALSIAILGAGGTGRGVTIVEHAVCANKKSVAAGGWAEMPLVR